MAGKFLCGMFTGLIVGAVAGASAKCMLEKNETSRIKRKAKKLINKVEKYVNEKLPSIE